MCGLNTICASLLIMEMYHKFLNLGEDLTSSTRTIFIFSISWQVIFRHRLQFLPRCILLDQSEVWTGKERVCRSSMNAFVPC